ncbi:MAG: thioredoxin domain-containing protein, partial [Desulfobacterales bacterium]|nr:thioredoxin domain-containing protein [Desulfobacterales bacterium]
YMSAVQAITGSGGWPLNVWLTPERKPFYGGTYFPARDGDRGAATGFITILKGVNEVYDSGPKQIAETSLQLTALIQKRLKSVSGENVPGPEVIHQAIDYYKKGFDPVYGGLNGAPKFPSSLPIRLLLRYHRRTNDKDVLNMAKLTLEKMAAGGMYDHVGGGFHRYSTDNRWLVPHFEKMLYDNALLVMDYLEGYQVTGEEAFRRVAEEILNYVKKDMTSSEGAFYSATDADSITPRVMREEGYYFTWTSEELEKILGPEKSQIVKRFYSVGPESIFEGRNIFNRTESVKDIADDLKMSEKELLTVIDDSKSLLYLERSKRPLPLRDEKVITSWNGLMISAFARTGLLLGDSQYVDCAIHAAQFILKHLYSNGKLYRSYKDGYAKNIAYLEDYAFFISALIDLYEATFDLNWLKNAIQLEAIMAEGHEDIDGGGFFMTGRDHEDLIAREKPNYDGALPSGNSIAILNLLRLNEFTAKAGYLDRAEKAIKAFLGSGQANPAAMSEMLVALDYFLDKSKEIIVVTPEAKDKDLKNFMEAFRKEYIPNRILIAVSGGKDLERQAEIIPLLEGKAADKGKVTAFVCESGACDLPATDPEMFAKQIRKTNKY